MPDNDRLSKAITEHDQVIARTLKTFRETLEALCQDIKKLEDILKKGYKQHASK